MKKTEVFFRPIEGSAPLSIYWYPGPYGDAIEANNESGVGFFSATGELLGVIFDDVKEKRDDQVLEFDRYRVEVSVRNGKVTHSFSRIEKQRSRPLRSRTTREAS